MYEALSKERKQTSKLCDAINNAVKATKEKNALLREQTTTKRKYSFENAKKILAGMEVDRATYINATKFLYEPKWSPHLL